MLFSFRGRWAGYDECLVIASSGLAVRLRGSYMSDGRLFAFQDTGCGEMRTTESPSKD